MTKKITRRDFMRGSAAMVLGTAAGLSSLSAESKSSTVILIRDHEVLDENFSINPAKLQGMFDQAITALFKRKTAQEAMKKIIKPTDIVGIKSNEWNYLPTPDELVQAIKKRVIEVGVSEPNIGIGDRKVKQMPIFKQTTALINVRPMRTHYLAGMSGCMKNLITFAQRYPDYHPNNCANLGQLLDLPMVKDKIRLHVLCLLTPQFHGRGPHHFNRRYVWAYKGLLLSQDPVAVDRIGLEILLAKRKQQFGRKYRIAPIPRYIEIADKTHNKGISDLNKIKLVKLGWQEDILI